MRITGIQNEGTCFVSSHFKCIRTQRMLPSFQYFINTVIALNIHHYIQREVGRGCHQPCSYFFDEFFFGHIPAQGIIGFFLMTQGIGGFLAHVFATGTAGTMGRIHNNIISQGHDLIP